LSSKKKEKTGKQEGKPCNEVRSGRGSGTAGVLKKESWQLTLKKNRGCHEGADNRKYYLRISALKREERGRRDLRKVGEGKKERQARSSCFGLKAGTKTQKERRKGNYSARYERRSGSARVKASSEVVTRGGKGKKKKKGRSKKSEMGEVVKA